MIRRIRRIICTKDNPWGPLSPPKMMVLHPDAQKADHGEFRDDTGKMMSVERYCPNCGYTWEKEVPE